jgi:hypothetical protein
MLPKECFERAKSLVRSRITWYEQGKISEDDLLWALSESILLMFPRDCIAVIASSSLDGKPHLHRTLILNDWLNIIDAGLFFQKFQDDNNIRLQFDFLKEKNPEKQFGLFIENVESYFRTQNNGKENPNNANDLLQCSFDGCADNIVDEELSEIRYLYFFKPNCKVTFLLFTSSFLSADELNPLYSFLSKEISYFSSLVGAAAPRNLIPFTVLPSDFDDNRLDFLDKTCRDIEKNIFSVLGCRENIETKPIVSLLIDSRVAGKRGFRHLPRVSLSKLLGGISSDLFPLIRKLSDQMLFSLETIESAIHQELNHLRYPTQKPVTLDGSAKEIIDKIRSALTTPQHNSTDKLYIFNALPSLCRFLENYHRHIKTIPKNWENALNKYLMDILLPRTDNVFTGGYCVFSVMARRYKFWYSWRNGPPSRFFKGYYFPQFLNIEEIFFPYPHVIYFPFFRNGDANIVLQIVTQNYMMCRRPEKLQSLLLEVTKSEVDVMRGLIEAMNGSETHKAEAIQLRLDSLMASKIKQVVEHAKRWEEKNFVNREDQAICMRFDGGNPDHIVHCINHSISKDPERSYEKIQTIFANDEIASRADRDWVLDKIIEGEREIRP